MVTGLVWLYLIAKWSISQSLGAYGHPLRFPFYSWIRAGTLLYLVLPQTQGAVLLYQSYIDPFLFQHESEIDTFISSAHDRAKAAGLQYIKQAIEFVKVNVLGLPPNRLSSPASTSGGGTYAQSLLARFHLPAARAEPVATQPSAADLYGLMAAFLGQSNSSGSTHEAAAAAVLDDPRITEDRINFITTQRDRINALLVALDREKSSLQTSAAPLAEQDNPGSMKKNKSETDFERVERDEAGEDKGRATSGSWLPWSWGSSTAAPPTDGKKQAEAETAQSTGFQPHTAT